MKTILQDDSRILRDHLNMISDDLGDLFLMIDTLAIGLESEGIEPQVIACFRSVGKCVVFIQRFASVATEVIIEEDDTEKA